VLISIIMYLSRYKKIVPEREGLCMNANGPAIWGGCVTRRNSGRPPVPVFGRGFHSAGKGGYGALFAVMAQIFLSITSVALQV